MDTWLAVASRREVCEYADRDVPEDVVQRVLDAGADVHISRLGGGELG